MNPTSGDECALNLVKHALMLPTRSCSPMNFTSVTSYITTYVSFWCPLSDVRPQWSMKDSHGSPSH